MEGSDSVQPLKQCTPVGAFGERLRPSIHGFKSQIDWSGSPTFEELLGSAEGFKPPVRQLSTKLAEEQWPSEIINLT
jgi:hypothetical protein